jgi:hypothetical protein
VLRLSLLTHIWCAYASGDRYQLSAAVVVRAAIATVRAEILLSYGRFTFARDLINEVSPRFAAMRRSLPASDCFEGFWLRSGLAALEPVDEGGHAAVVAAQDAQDGPQPRLRLVIRLSETAPVQAPPFPAM